MERPETSLTLKDPGSEDLGSYIRKLRCREKIIYWVMVCDVMLAIPDLIEAKFRPVYGGRNWGWKESSEFLLPQKVDFYTALPFCPA